MPQPLVLRPAQTAQWALTRAQSGQFSAKTATPGTTPSPAVISARNVLRVHTPSSTVAKRALMARAATTRPQAATLVCLENIPWLATRHVLHVLQESTKKTCKKIHAVIALRARTQALARILAKRARRASTQTPGQARALSVQSVRLRLLAASLTANLVPMTCMPTKQV
jgi:hypothetical protein